MPDSPNPQPLLCHPATPAPIVSRVDASVELISGGRVAFRYCLRGDMARLRVPPEKIPARTDLLWEHTCFEAFIAQEGGKGYREFNFSPSGLWAAYDFSDYRQRLPEDPAIQAPQIATRLTEGRLELEAIVREADLPHSPTGHNWRIGLAAVVEAADTVDGSHSYWALHHPALRPDFHHLAGFLAQVTPAGATEPLDRS